VVRDPALQEYRPYHLLEVHTAGILGHAGCDCVSMRCAFARTRPVAEELAVNPQTTFSVHKQFCLNVHFPIVCGIAVTN
jgi:hypothetical protein